MWHSKIYLPHPLKDEKIEMVLRRHSLVLWRSLLVVAILALAPAVLHWLIASLFLNFLQGSLVAPLVFLASSLYYLFMVVFFFAAFLDYWLDVWIVTNERIVSIEQAGLFSRQFTEQQLYRLQDVTSKVEGMIPTFFHYGDVLVQSAGTVQNSVFHQVPKADTVARRIIGLMESSKQRHKMENW